MQPTNTHYIKLISPASGPKPETTVVAEVDGVRQRFSFEPLHYHGSNETICKVCGKSGYMVWTDSEGTFNRDSLRCGVLTVE